VVVQNGTKLMELKTYAANKFYCLDCVNRPVFEIQNENKKNFSVTGFFAILKQ
jgi:hypothetical protein